MSEWQMYGDRKAPTVVEVHGRFALCFSDYWSVREKSTHGTVACALSFADDEAAAREHLAGILKRPVCRECGEHQSGKYFPDVEKRMSDLQLCFWCLCWTESLAAMGPDTAIVSGYYYTIGDEASTSHFRGHGGAKFVIEFNDGRRVTTTNLWAAGPIPANFRERMPDNAHFAEREHSYAYVGLGSASV